MATTAPNPQARLVLGLNPAWQKTLAFDHFIHGAVNRATQATTLASGKGINALRACTTAGSPATVAQFAGGQTGQLLTEALDASGAAHITVKTHVPTRTCTTILSRAEETMTELIEPSGPILELEVAELTRALMPALDACQVLAICGTFPTGVPNTFYAEAIARARSHAIVLVDACRDVCAALAAGPHILKVNQEELLALAGADTVPQAIAALREHYPQLVAIAVTAGPGQAFLATSTATARFDLPRLERVVSPLGAGDCAMGVLTHHLGPHPGLGGISPQDGARLEDTFLIEAFKDALAAASASCMNAVPGAYDPKTAIELKGKIGVTRA